MIAALFVQTGGCYFGLPDVDPWDVHRDARKYAGPWPVVAHPPCARWCRLAGFVEARWGYRRGDDEGCFASALTSVRQYGGVLEHPAGSSAWPAFGLARPTSGGGWTRSMFDVGWVCEVSQLSYGHKAQKVTWLYAVSKNVPSLIWTRGDGEYVVAPHRNSDRRKPRLSSREISASPHAFRDILLSIARSVVLTTT